MTDLGIPDEIASALLARYMKGDIDGDELYQGVEYNQLILGIQQLNDDGDIKGAFEAIGDFYIWADSSNAKDSINRLIQDMLNDFIANVIDEQSFKAQ